MSQEWWLRAINALYFHKNKTWLPVFLLASFFLSFFFLFFSIHTYTYAPTPCNHKGQKHFVWERSFCVNIPQRRNQLNLSFWTLTSHWLHLTLFVPLTPKMAALVCFIFFFISIKTLSNHHTYIYHSLIYTVTTFVCFFSYQINIIAI